MDEALIFGPSAQAIWLGKKRKRQASANVAGSGVNATHVAKLGEAEQLYIEGRLVEAVRVLSDISKEVPRWSEPYTVLALIYEALGQKKEALQLYMLCAAFQSRRKRSIEPWRKVVYFAYDMKQFEQSLHAMGKCLKGEETEESQELRRFRLILLVKVSKLKIAISALKQHSDAHPQDHAIYLDFANALLEEGYPGTALRFYKNFLSRFGILIEADPALFPASSSATKSLASVNYDGEYIRLRGTNLLEEIANHYDEISYAILRTCALTLSLYNLAELVIESIETFFSLHCSIAALRDVVFPMSLVSLLSRAKLISQPDPGPALLQLDPLLAPSALAHNLQDTEVLEQLVACAGKIMALGMVAKGLRLCDAAADRLTQLSAEDDPVGLVPRCWLALSEAYLHVPTQGGQRGPDAVVTHSVGCLRHALRVLPQGRRAVEVLAQALDLGHGLLGLVDSPEAGLSHRVQADVCEVCTEIRSRAWTVLRALVLDCSALLATRTTSLGVSPHEARGEDAAEPHGTARRAMEDDDEDEDEDEYEDDDEDDEEEEGDGRGHRGALPPLASPPPRARPLAPAAALPAASLPAASLPLASLPSGEDVGEADAPGADMDEEAAAEAMEALLHLSSSVARDAAPPRDSPEASHDRPAPQPLAVFTRHACSRHILSAVCVFLVRWTRAVHWEALAEAPSPQRQWARVLLHAKLVDGLAMCAPLCTGRAGARRPPREILPTSELSQAAASLSRGLFPLPGASLDAVLPGDDDAHALAVVFCATARFCPAPGTRDILGELTAALEAEVTRLRAAGQAGEAEAWARLVQPSALEAVERAREREAFSRLAAPRRASPAALPGLWSSLHLALSLEDRPGGGGSFLLGEASPPFLFNASSRDRKLLHLLEQYVRSLDQLANPLARKAAKVFLLQPDNVAAINLLARALLPPHRAVEDALSVRVAGHLKTQTTALTEMLMGNEEALYKRHGPVLQHYLQAVHLLARQQVDQAGVAEGGLVFLLLGSYLLMLANHPIMKQRQDLLMRAWAVLTLYAQARIRSSARQGADEGREGGQAHPEHVQEVYYNMGRACQEVRLDHVAVTYYRMALRLEEHSVHTHGKSLRLTRQAAHNLVLLYTQAGSLEVAYDLVASYLTFA